MRASHPINAASEKVISMFAGRSLVYCTSMQRRLVFHLAILATAAVQAASAASAQLFSADDELELRLRAPVAALLARGSPGQDDAVDGTLAYTDAGKQVTIDDVRITLRGNTSRRDNECTFPKLTLELKDSPAVRRSIFQDIRELKVGTHCGERREGELTPLGRVANEQSVVRETFVYQLLEAMGVPSFKTRAARIAYDDPTAGTKPLVRRAMLIEDADLAMARLHARREIELEQFGWAGRDLAPADVASLNFAEAMIGNFDWCLRMSPEDTYRCDATKPLWNIAVFAREDGTTLPVPYDFDLAGIVTGRHPWFGDVFDERFSVSRSQVEVEVLSQLQRARSLFPRDLLDATRQRFLNREPQARQAVEESKLDPQGRRQATAYLTAFFDAIATDAAFYRPVVIAEDTSAYASPNGPAVVCPDSGTIPVGTPVSAPLEVNGNRVRVHILDALWHWAGNHRCDAIRHGDVWVDRQAIGTQYP